MMSTAAPVLYIEDEENDIFFMTRAFDKSGLADRLHVVRNGEQALAYLTAAAQSGAAPCLVLLDLNLPRISGFEVLQRLRKIGGCEKTPVCVLTSSEDPKDITSARQSGANDYQVKPSSPRQLTHLVQSICHRWGVGRM